MYKCCNFAACVKVRKKLLSSHRKMAIEIYIHTCISNILVKHYKTSV